MSRNLAGTRLMYLDTISMYIKTDDQFFTVHRDIIDIWIKLYWYMCRNSDLNNDEYTTIIKVFDELVPKLTYNSLILTFISCDYREWLENLYTEYVYNAMNRMGRPYCDAHTCRSTFDMFRCATILMREERHGEYGF